MWTFRNDLPRDLDKPKFIVTLHDVDGGFLRFDRPELQDGRLVLRAVDRQLRENRRHGSASPLAYLYERDDPDEPDRDLSLTAGHYDQADMVWVFSGEVPGIIGLTEPLQPVAEPPDR
jgi:hypothetical protein